MQDSSPVRGTVASGKSFKTVLSFYTHHTHCTQLSAFLLWFVQDLNYSSVHSSSIRKPLMGQQSFKDLITKTMFIISGKSAQATTLTNILCTISWSCTISKKSQLYKANQNMSQTSQRILHKKDTVHYASANLPPTYDSTFMCCYNQSKKAYHFLE